jgi:hypothetical protein
MSSFSPYEDVHLFIYDNIYQWIGLNLDEVELVQFFDGKPKPDDFVRCEINILSFGNGAQGSPKAGQVVQGNLRLVGSSDTSLGAKSKVWKQSTNIESCLSLTPFNIGTGEDVALYAPLNLSLIVIPPFQYSNYLYVEGAKLKEDVLSTTAILEWEVRFNLPRRGTNGLHVTQDDSEELDLDTAYG